MCTLVSDAFNIDLQALRGDDLPAESLEYITSTDKKFTSSVTLQVEGEMLLFVSNEDGILLKV